MGAAMNSSLLSANGNMEPISLSLIVLNSLVLILTLPINIYVLWLIITGAGNGLTSEYLSLNLCMCEIVICFATIPNILSNVTYGTQPQGPFPYILAFVNTIHTIARPLFQCCICVERYVAVIHPITFLRCKSLKRRMTFSTMAWLIVLGFSVLAAFLTLRSVFCYVVLPQYLIFFSVMLFCSVAVLKALRKPAPGERLTDKESEANRMKKKAFSVILIILIFMVLTYGPVMVYIFLFDVLSEPQRWEGLSMFFYLSVIAGLVQPFLYLHRVGKLPFR